MNKLDAKTLYDKTALECSALITRRYSTSFGVGVRLLSKEQRGPIGAIYAFARYTDEIVDTFDDPYRGQLLKAFRRDTYQAVKHNISTNPVLHAFALVVNAYKIDTALVEAFFVSMEMDITKKTYTKRDFLAYVYGSGEVIGLMCLKIFCADDKALYEQLKLSARKLGSAFQKINFLRDIRSDYQDRGRVYFPDLKLNRFSAVQKQAIQSDIEIDIEAARVGLQALPRRSKPAVLLVTAYNEQLLIMIKNISPRQLLQNRVRVPAYIKLWLLAKVLLVSLPDLIGSKGD